MLFSIFRLLVRFFSMWFSNESQMWCIFFKQSNMTKAYTPADDPANNTQPLLMHTNNWLYVLCRMTLCLLLCILNILRNDSDDNTAQNEWKENGDISTHFIVSTNSDLFSTHCCVTVPASAEKLCDSEFK